MPSFNSIQLMGNMTRAIEIKYLTTGTAVGEFGLAINRVWKDDKGNKHESVTFVDVTVWGKSAETIQEYTEKGSAIFIQGRLEQDTWDDKKTGEKRSKLKVICEQFRFIDFKKKEVDGEQPPAQPTRQPGGGPPKGPPSKKPAGAPKPPSDPDLDSTPDDSIPF